LIGWGGRGLCNQRKFRENGFDRKSTGTGLILRFDALAELLSVWFEDPLTCIQIFKKFEKIPPSPLKGSIKKLGHLSEG
jgi:hypothetical protein